MSMSMQREREITKASSMWMQKRSAHWWELTPELSSCQSQCHGSNNKSMSNCQIKYTCVNFSSHILMNRYYFLIPSMLLLFNVKKDKINYNFTSININEETISQNKIQKIKFCKYQKTCCIYNSTDILKSKINPAIRVKQ